jgi:hypothetical protein
MQMKFLHDRPIRELDADLLWREDPDIIEQIRDVSVTITDPLREGSEPGESMTFAIHGHWGMGKSSAMKLIQAQASRLAAGALSRLYFSEYLAPMHEAMLLNHTADAVDVRAALGLSIVQSLAGQVPADRTQWLLENFGKSIQHIRTDPEDSETIQLSRLIQELSYKLTGLHDFDRLIERFLAGENSVLVVMIDDLDRCEHEYVWKILNTIQQWSRIQNLFFVLALDRAHLRQSLEGRALFSEKVDLALEKYVQHAIYVPRMDERGIDYLAGYLRALGQTYAEKGDVFQALVENCEIFHYGLRVQSPRAIKRFVNVAGRRISNVLRRASRDSIEVARFIKERLLEYSWPDFYEDEYRRAKADEQFGQQTYHAMLSLEESCRQYFADKDEPRLRFELARIDRQMGVSWSGLPTDLARFFGARPSLFLDPSHEPVEPPSGDKTHALFTDFLSAEVLPREVSNEAVEVVHDPEAVLSQLFYDLQIAEHADHEKVWELAEQVERHVLDHREVFEVKAERAAALLGDIAAIIARIDGPRSFRLFQLALSHRGTDRVYVNNLQRFVAAVITGRIERLYPVAGECIKILSSPPLDHVRLDHTRVLQQGFEMLTGTTMDLGFEDLDDEIETFRRDPSNEFQFTGLLSVCASRGRYEDVRSLARTRYSYVERGSEDAYTTLRLLADALAGSDDEVDESDAISLFTFILTGGAVSSERLDPDDVPDIQHNLAVLLNKHDYDDEAGKWWYRAYKAKPSDTNIQRAYARYLARAKRPDLAAKAARGEAIDEEILIPTNKVLPKRFPGERDHWWQEER